MMLQLCIVHYIVLENLKASPYERFKTAIPKFHSKIMIYADILLNHLIIFEATGGGSEGPKSC